MTGECHSGNYLTIQSYSKFGVTRGNKLCDNRRAHDRDFGLTTVIEPTIIGLVVTVISSQTKMLTHAINAKDDTLSIQLRRASAFIALHRGAGAFV